MIFATFFAGKFNKKLWTSISFCAIIIIAKLSLNILIVSMYFCLSVKMHMLLSYTCN